ncbi:MAG: DegV family protein [Oscillospiraceae bacterium]
MSSKFILSCESTVDLPFEYISGRNIPVIFYSYTVDGKEYVDDMLRDPNALPAFYNMLKAGKLPSTSQLNEFLYEEFFEEQVKKGDLLHIAFGSGMTQSVRNAERAAKQLRDKYPDRKIIVIDSLCSSSGYGMLVDYAADMRDSGCSIEETEKWVMDNRQKIHHQFFSTELEHYRRSGRMSGATAMIATILGICPIMRLDDKGRIIAYSKVRGKANAIKTTLDTMEMHAQGGKDYSEKCWICHSQCLEDAEKTKQALIERFPNIKGEIKICDIGTIIASHCGPGTVAVFFIGDKRTPE